MRLITRAARALRQPTSLQMLPVSTSEISAKRLYLLLKKKYFMGGVHCRGQCKQAQNDREQSATSSENCQALS